MKKIIFISIILLSTFNLYAQKQNRFERIKALKTAYITDKVGLTSQEAEKFWPIYNKYEKELHLLKVVERREILQKLKDEGGLETLSESDAKSLKNNILELRNEIFTKEQEKFKAIDKVLSAKKMIKLYGAEESFKKELLQRFKGQQQRGNKF